MQIDNKKIINRFNILNLGYFIAMNIAYAYLIIYLKKSDFSFSQIGIITSIQLLLGSVGNIFSGIMCDKLRKIKPVLIGFMIALVINVFILYLSDNTTVITISAITLGLIWQSNMGIIESWPLEINDVVRDNYGLIRGFASLSWAIGGLIFAPLLDNYGFSVVPYIVLVITVYALIFIRFIPEGKQEITTNKMINFNEIKNIVTNKDFIIVVSSITMYSIAIKMSENTVVFNIEQLNGGSKATGLLYFVQSIAEFIMFSFMIRVNRKVKSPYLILGAGIMQILRITLCILFNSIPLLITFGILQFITFVWYNVAQKRLLYNISKEHVRSSTILVATAIISGIGASIGAYLSGMITDRYGINKSFFVSGLFVLISLCIILIYRKRYNYS